MSHDPAQANETWIACLTPPGAAAIAALGVYGPQAWNVALQLFRRPRAPHELPADAEPGQFWFGRLTGEVADEVVLTLKQLQPTPWVEIHSHGGRQVVAGVRSSFEALGLRGVSWQELEQRRFPDGYRALASASLAEATTLRTAGILLDQQQGALDRAMADLNAARQRGDREEAEKTRAELLRHADLGLHLTQPWRIVVAGAPNVGKSSLVNALAGYQRSVVAAEPGTTRDVVRTRLAVEGWPIDLLDTAGLREQGEELEQAGMDLARAEVAGADLVLWVLDATNPVLPSGDNPRVRLVLNKIDLPGAQERADALRVSAKTGEGVVELAQRLAEWLVPEPPAPGAAVPFTPELIAALRHDSSASSP